jgi:hypothetical protein
MLGGMNRNSSSHIHSSCFERIFDAAVIGGGYAGFAAVERLRAAGQSVLWIDRQAAPLWEGGWAFHDRAGESELPAWRAWTERLQQLGAMRAGRIDGAIAEVTAAARVRGEGWSVLGYATPVAVERVGALIGAVVFGTKSGLRRIQAQRWIDATDDGELVRLLGAVPEAPLSRRIALHRRRHDAVDGPLWADEHRLELDLAAGERTYAGWLRLLSNPADQWVVTHGSVVPFAQWRGTQVLAPLPANVASAVPAFAGTTLATLAERYAVGFRAAEQALAAPAAAPVTGALPEIAAVVSGLHDVVVAGTGTGGALAALAAARAGATVTAVDPLPFAGGIGAGGGIHWYYWGMKGGLQEHLDVRVRELMPRFAAAGQIQGFHPDAKKCALDGLLSEAGVQMLTGTLVAVRREGRTIADALVATPQGPVRLAAKAWVDGTGDGDLCAQAGCATRFGRDGDGLPHAFSQSSGKAWLTKQGRVQMGVINFDQNFVDATDVEDLTWARYSGIAQYTQQRYEGANRPTYIAPAIGLRQSRHVVTRRTLELADLIERRRFPDVVGITGCHYDNHASDYEFESDEGMYWVWACRSWHTRTACEIPLGILVPRDLDNAWIASRCLGVSQDAHHSLRMQRDMQRIGEVAGLAAAQAARTGTVAIAQLQAELRASGALTLQHADDDFGPDMLPAWFDQALTDVRDPQWNAAGLAMWRLYRAGDAAAVRPLLNAGATVSWRAAAVLAMLGDAAALPRLWQAIAAREDGFADQEESLRPEKWNRVLPVWRQAITLLRRCGGTADLARLAQDFSTESLHASLVTQLATTVEALARRGAVATPAVAVLLQRCAVVTAGLTRDPQQNPSHIGTPAPVPAATDRQGVRVDAAWQVALSVARAQQALGLPVSVVVPQDERLLVRRAFAQLASGVATAAAAR